MKMLKWYKIDTEIPEADFVKQIEVAHRKLCLVKDQGTLYAMQNTCPHAGGILSGGWCKKGHLVCPIHRWEYNLQTGRGATGQGDYIDVYPLDLKPNGEVYIGIKENWLKRLLG